MAISEPGATLNDKTANLLADALARTLETVGLSATELAETMLGIKVSTTDEKFLQMGYKGYFFHQFKQMPDPSKAQLDQLLTTIKGLGSAPHKLRCWMKQKIEELPHAAGGPPRKVKSEDETSVCAEIQALLVEYGPREAIRHVARKRNASERTIYRIWGKYHPKKKKARPNSP